MSTSNTLKEFLVKIGFKVDEQQFRRFDETMRKVSQGAAELGKSSQFSRFNQWMQEAGKSVLETAQTAAAASVVLGAGIEAVAKQMESLYYASQRTGSSVKELKEFSFAASQVGVSADAAQAAIEGLAAARRTNPGVNGLLQSYGIDARQRDNASVLLQILVKLRAMPHYQGAQVAERFGINEETFNQLEQGLPEMQKYIALREKMFRQSGIDPQDMATRGKEFSQEWRTFNEQFKTTAEIIAYRLMPAGEQVMHWLEQMAGWFFKADQATSGWSSKLLGLAVALKGVGVARGALGKLFASGVARTAVAEGAETLAGGAAVEGAGGLAAMALPAIIISAVGAALVWMTAHPEQVRKAVGGALKAVGNEAEKVALGLKEGVDKLGTGKMVELLASSISPSLGNAIAGLKDGSTGNTLAPIASLISPMLGDATLALTNWIARNEGFRSKAYPDHKGMSIGYGHLLRPGDSDAEISKSDALGFLSRDITSALASVHELVKVRLSKNQESALADFVFNLGKGSLQKSTLLKDLNRGDYAGAASEFARWNKVLDHGHYIVDQGLVNRRAQDAALFRAPDKAVSISQKTDIHVSGGADDSTARKIAGHQDRVNGDMVRNFSMATR